MAITGLCSKNPRSGESACCSFSDCDKAVVVRSGITCFSNSSLVDAFDSHSRAIV